MPEMKPPAATPTPNAATERQSGAGDEKDVTFDAEMEPAGSHAAETKPSRQVPDEDLDEVFRDNRVHDTDGELEEEPPQAGGSTFDEIDRAARAVKNPKAGKADILQAGKVFHELEGTESVSYTHTEPTRPRLISYAVFCLKKKKHTFSLTLFSIPPNLLSMVETLVLLYSFCTFPTRK